MKLTIRDEADTDALEAALYYYDVRPKLGVQFRERLKAAYESIAFNPWQFPKVTHHLVGGDARIAMLKQFPYVVVFEIFTEEIVVFAVDHSHRNDPWIERLE